MRIAICDDDIDITVSLCEMAGHLLKSRHILFGIHQYHDGLTLLEDIDKNFDVIFLDIGMEGMDGLETAKRIREIDKNVAIIYVTTFEEHRSTAFTVHAFGYIVKPFSENEIQNILSDVIEYREEKKNSQEILIETSDGNHMFHGNDIFYFEYCDRKIDIVCKEGKFTAYCPLKKVMDKMISFDFASPHQSFLVNLFHVKSIKGYDIIMNNNDIIPLSQKKSAEFRKMHNLYAAENYHVLRGGV